MRDLGPLKNGLSLFDRLFIWFFYFMRSLRYDLPENQVGWRSRQNQERRFKALLGIGDIQGARLLDLGCGLGCLYGYLKGRGWNGKYTGIDILHLMVNKAKRRFPSAAFEKRDILKNPPSGKWDYVLINGVLNHKVKDNWAWMEAMVLTSFALAEKGLAFNLLNAEVGWEDPELFYADPKILEEKVRVWSKGNFKIVTGYLPEDTTVFMYH
jgi:SAM-dependent methyltransferase